MADKTEYIVQTSYVVKDDASHGLEKIGDAADHAHEHAEGLRDVLKEVGETFMLFEGVEKAKELFVGFNAEMQTAKIQMQAIVGVNFKKSWEEAGAASSEMFEGFEKMAEEFPVSAKEMMESVKELSVGVAQAGGNMEDLRIITERGAIAQKVFGLSSRELMMALEGRISAKSPGGMMLLNETGLTREQWKKLTKESRLALTKQALQSDVITKAGDEFAGSFAGQASMLKDRLEVAAGKVGLPLFKALNEELKHWNEWLTKNSVKIEEMGHKIGEGLVSGFKVLKEVAAFIYDHSDILIKVAEAWALHKGFEALGSIGGALGKNKAVEMAGGLLGKIPGASAVGAGAKEFFGGVTTWAPIAMVAGKVLGEELGAAVHPGVQRLKEMEASVTRLDEHFRDVAEASKKLEGAIATLAASRMKTVAEEDTGRVAVLKAALRMHGSMSGTAREIALKAGGFDRTEIQRMGGVSDFALMRQLGESAFGLDVRQNKLGLATSATDVGIKLAMEHFTKDQRAHINVAKATNLIMEKQFQLLAAGKMPLNEEGIKKFLLENKEIQSEQAKINQTVNIHIDQVSAKDPDRWISDLDDYAARKARSRTRARGALARGH